MSCIAAARQMNALDTNGVWHCQFTIPDDQVKSFASGCRCSTNNNDMLWVNEYHELVLVF